MYIGQDVKRTPAWLRILANGKPLAGAEATYAIQVRPGIWEAFGGEVPSDQEGKILFDDVPMSATVGDSTVPVQKVRYKVSAPGFKTAMVDVDPNKMPKMLNVTLQSASTNWPVIIGVTAATAATLGLLMWAGGVFKKEKR